jgi:hypothetical protein
LNDYAPQVIKPVKSLKDRFTTYVEANLGLLKWNGVITKRYSYRSFNRILNSLLKLGEIFIGDTGIAAPDKVLWVSSSGFNGI